MLKSKKEKLQEMIETLYEAVEYLKVAELPNALKLKDDVLSFITCINNEIADEFPDVKLIGDQLCRLIARFIDIRMGLVKDDQSIDSLINTLNEYSERINNIHAVEHGIKIFTFWENVNGKEKPAYINLCMKTWAKNIPDCEVICVNYSNLREYIGDCYDIERLKRISLPCQSDIISFALLERYGGLWLDADTIVTKNITKQLREIKDDKIVMFGEHLAFIYAKNPGNKALKAMVDEAASRLQSLEENLQPLPWDYFGNQILTKVKNKGFKNEFYSLDVQEEGYILERTLPALQYLALYFFPIDLDVNAVLNNAKFGVIGLHNSWTPPEYRNLNDENEVFSKNVIMSKLLKEVLSKS